MSVVPFVAILNTTLVGFSSLGGASSLVNRDLKNKEEEEEREVEE